MKRKSQEWFSDWDGYRVGSIAVYRRYVTLEQAQVALKEQIDDDLTRSPHRRLDEIFLNHGWITEAQMRSIREEIGFG